MWDQIAAITPVKPASLSAPPAPRLRGATVGPLAGDSGTPALAGGIRDDALAAPISPPPATDPIDMPVPRLRSDVVDRKPLIRIAPGVKNFAEDFAAGLARDASTSPPIAAFGQGLAGAISSENERGYREAKAILDAQERADALEERAYDRGRDALSDRRADLETAAKIKGGFYDRPTADDKWVGEDGKLTVEAFWKIDERVQNLRDTRLNALQSGGRRIKPEEMALVEEEAAAYERKLTETIIAGGSMDDVPPPPGAAPGAPGAPAEAPATPAAPAAPAAPPAPKPGGEAVAVPPAGYTGNGTPESPYAGGDGPPPGMKTGQVWTDGTTLYRQK